MTLVANLNLDMYLPMHALKQLRVLGLEESTLGDAAREVAHGRGLTVHGDLQPERNSFIRSDQYSFIKQGIPAINLGFSAPADSPEGRARAAWLKERYHAPSDDLAQPVDKDAAVEFNRLIAEVITRVANAADRPRWQEKSFFKRFAH
jgi:Zn-dependent M28 family amino/carboxypeptidase